MKALAREIKRYIAVFVYFKKVDFLGRLAYRFNFFLMLFGVFFKVFFNLVFIRVIFSWVKSIQGWNYYEVLLIAGTVMLIDGLMWTSVAYLHIIKNLIREGQLDGLLTKPIDSQFLASVYRGDLEDIVRVITGLGVIIFAFSHFNLSGGSLILNLFWYLFLVINSLVVMYSIALMLYSISFWTIEVSSSFVVIMQSAQDPTDIFGNKILRYFFTFGLPIAFIGTVPAKIFSRGFDGWWIIGSFIIAIFFFSISRFVWKQGLNKYSSASS